MKILSLGLDNSILNKSSALARRAVEYGDLVEKYSVIAPSEKGESIELSEKVRVYGSGGSDKLRQFIRIYNLAKKLSREGKYDIITVQDQYYLALIGWRLAKKFNAGLEIQVHGFEKYFGLRKLIAKYVLPRANAVRCVSQRLKRQLIGEFGVREERIMIVPIYIEVRSRKLEVRSERNDSKFIFLTVGRLVPVKNIGLQIEAMREVVKKYPEAELWIVGDGAEKKKLEARSKKLELEKKIKLLGWQDDLADNYKKVDTFVLTSNFEGWGLAVIEAASFGLPIIMTDVGCAGEAIKNGESGLVIPVGDKRRLVEAMLRIMADVALREKLSGGAKLAVSRLPSKDQTLELYKKSWEKAMKNS